MTDLASWVFLIVGLLGGFVLSGLLWWYLNHWLVPKFQFSQEIAKRTSSLNPCGFMYRIKMRNVGKRRAIDLQIRARIAIYELGLKKTWNWFDIDISGNSIPTLPVGSNRLIVLRPFETAEFSRSIFPPHVRQKLADQMLTMEDVLSLGTKSFVRIYVFAYDEFSGARKVFLSEKYTSKEIRTGVFRDLVVSSKTKAPTPHDEQIDHDPRSMKG